jgi:hypothetical protein
MLQFFVKELQHFGTFNLGMTTRVGFYTVSFIFLKKENKRMPFQSLMQIRFYNNIFDFIPDSVVFLINLDSFLNDAV